MIKISQQDLVREHVVNGYTRAQIAEKLGCSPRTISRLFNKYKITGSRYKGIYTKNNNFFNVPSVTNSYWAGFIAADGCITTPTRSNPMLIINLASRDEILLSEFMQVTKYNGTITETVHINKKTKKIHQGRRLSIYNAKQWTNDLNNNWRITSKKSLTLQPPKIVDTNLQLQYIIGLIDGDGYIGISNNKLYFSLLGTKELLEWVSLILNQLETYTPMVVSAKDKKSKVFKIQCNHLRAYKLLSQLQTIQTPFRLERKWNKIKEYENFR